MKLTSLNNGTAVAVGSKQGVGLCPQYGRLHFRDVLAANNIKQNCYCKADTARYTPGEGCFGMVRTPQSRTPQTSRHAIT